MEGIKPCLRPDFTCYTEKQPPERDPKVAKQVLEKLASVVMKGYVAWNPEIKSYMHYFSVPKGLDDIRMVYDLSKSGLNLCLWVPRFPLPNVETHLRAVVHGTWMGDLDVGEMFLNFPLHPNVQEVCGLDLSQYESAMEDLCSKEGVYLRGGRWDGHAVQWVYDHPPMEPCARLWWRKKSFEGIWTMRQMCLGGTEWY